MSWEFQRDLRFWRLGRGLVELDSTPIGMPVELGRQSSVRRAIISILVNNQNKYFPEVEHPQSFSHGPQIDSLCIVYFPRL